MKTESKPQVVVDNHDGRGASLEYKVPSSRMWLAVSYHKSLVDAMRGFASLPHFQDRDPSNYRIRVHKEDM